MGEIRILSVVALARDLPEHCLMRGQVGTVVEILKPGSFEIEFSDESGRACSTLALSAGDLIRLHHERANVMN